MLVPMSLMLVPMSLNSRIRRAAIKMVRFLAATTILGVLAVAALWHWDRSIFIKPGQPMSEEELRKWLQNNMLEYPAKDFELPALAGETYRLSSLRGRPVLINFWATWCGPCIDEMPYLIQLYKKHGQAGLEILAISIDQDTSKTRSFVAEHKLPFPVLLDDGQVGQLYGVGPIPDTIAVDPAGNIRYRQVGYGPALNRTFDLIVEQLFARNTSFPAPRSSEMRMSARPWRKIQEATVEGFLLLLLIVFLFFSFVYRRKR